MAVYRLTFCSFSFATHSTCTFTYIDAMSQDSFFFEENILNDLENKAKCAYIDMLDS